MLFDAKSSCFKRADSNGARDLTMLDRVSKQVLQDVLQATPIIIDSEWLGNFESVMYCLTIFQHSNTRGSIWVYSCSTTVWAS